MRFSMHIDGLEQLRQALRRLPEELQKKALGDSVAAGASVISKEAKFLAPVLMTPDPRRTPGLLQRMIAATKGKRNGSEAAAFVRVRRLVRGALRKKKAKTGLTGAELDPFYWAFVEFGTSKNKANSFLRKAFDTRKEDAARAIAKALGEGIDKAAAKVAGRKLF